MIPNLGPQELLIILAIFLFLFGAKKIPEMAKGCGTAIRELRSAAKELSDGDSEPKRVPDQVYQGDSSRSGDSSHPTTQAKT